MTLNFSWSFFVCVFVFLVLDIINDNLEDIASDASAREFEDNNPSHFEYSQARVLQSLVGWRCSRFCVDGLAEQMQRWVFADETILYLCF